MNWLFDLLSNRFLIAGLSSWFVAQVVKVIIHTIIHKEFDISRMVGDGGMPSGHSATVTALATMAGLVYGLGSFEFAMSAVFAVVVCHDATGVRQESGKHAIVLNELIRQYSDLAKQLPHLTLKEFVGHTLLQVSVGMALGCANALILYFFLYQ